MAHQLINKKKTKKKYKYYLELKCNLESIDVMSALEQFPLGKFFARTQQILIQKNSFTFLLTTI